MYRYFSLRWNNILNTEEDFNDVNKESLRLKHKYNVIYTSSNPKSLLLDTLQDLKLKKEIIIIYFIGCLNQFTT